MIVTCGVANCLENEKLELIYICEDPDKKDRSKVITIVTSSTSKKDEILNNEGKIIFLIKPTRLQLRNHKERLKVDLFIDMEHYDNKEDCGNVICNIMDIEKDLIKLREFGTGFLHKEILEIRHEIEKNYRKIETVDDDSIKVLDLDKDIQNILEMFCEYIVENDIVPDNIKGDNLYNIPVADFKEHLKDSDYRDYDYTEVKEKLRDLNYTKCNKGRSDNTVYKIVGEGKNAETKRFKAISFIAANEKVQKSIEQLK